MSKVGLSAPPSAAEAGRAEKEIPLTPVATRRMRVLVKEYLAGHLVERGLAAFEIALNGIVQQCMREAFPNEGDPDHAAALLQHAADVEEWRARVEKAKADAEAAFTEAKSAPMEEKRLKKASTKAKRAYMALAKKEPDSPVDVWVHKARSVLGSAMRSHVHGDCTWDTFTLVSVLRGFLEEVFVTTFGIDDLLEAKSLLSRLNRAAEARNLRAHGAMPKESETVDLLANLKATLTCCGLRQSAARVARFLGEAQELKQAAAEERGERQVAMAAKDQQALLLYRAFHTFESRLEEEAGEFEYKDGTYAFGKRVDTWGEGEDDRPLAQADRDRQLVKSQADNLRAVAKARHWLFHHADHEIDGVSVLAKMGEVLTALRGLAARYSHKGGPNATDGAGIEDRLWSWEWLSNDAQAEITVVLELSAGGMTIPVPRERCLVGRTATIQEVTHTLLSGSSSRVLVHGRPGMGKDVVAAEVVRSEAVGASGLKLQAWLQASTDGMLRNQLVDLFTAQMPEVFTGAEGGQEDRLEVIRQWLAVHDSWLLVVEDASWESKALWDYVPAGRGRLLVTSQMPLSKSAAEGSVRLGPLQDMTAFELEGLSESESIELLCRMNVLSEAGRERKLETCLSYAEMEYMCERFVASHDVKLPEESEEEQVRRLRAVVENLLEGVKALDREEQIERLKRVVKKLVEGGRKNAKARKKRMAALATAQLEYRELVTNEGLRTLLTEELGNVPLLVSLIGHSLRSMGSVDRFIELFHRVPLRHIDRAGLNPMTDRHYLGAVRSVLLPLQRLQAIGGEEWKAAARLLAVLAMLPSRTTPRSLFCSGDAGRVHILLNDEQPEETLRQAEELLERFGVTKRVDGDRAPTVHQMVQRVVREQWQGEEVMVAMRKVTRTVLARRLKLAGHSWDYMDTREIVPCAEWFCSREIDGTEAVEPGDFDLIFELSNSQMTEGRVLQAYSLLGRALIMAKRTSLANDFDYHLLQHNLARACMHFAKHEEALVLQEEVLEARRRTLPPEDPAIAGAMNNLALAYEAMGRYEEALTMQEEVLEVRRRILPNEDPGIATAMNNLAKTYMSLGRYEDALAMLEGVLEERRRFRPAGHPDIARAMNNLASPLRELGRHEEALAMREEALEALRRVLPAEHHEIVISMDNLTVMYQLVGRYEDALVLQRESLEISQRIFPAGHPDIAIIKGNMATSLSNLGRCEEALAIEEEVMASRRALPANCPDIPVGMINLAVIFNKLGRHEEALALLEEALELRKRSLPAEHPGIARAMRQVASMYDILGRHEEALAMQEEAMEACRRDLPAEHPDFATALCELARMYSTLGRDNEALATEEELLELRVQILPAEHRDIGSSLEKLAREYNTSGRHVEALEKQEAVLEFRRRVLPAQEFDILIAMSSVAETRYLLGRYGDAISMQNAALRLVTDLCSTGHSAIAECEYLLAKYHVASGMKSTAKARAHFQAAVFHADQALDTYSRAFDERAIQCKKLLRMASTQLVLLLVQGGV